MALKAEQRSHIDAIIRTAEIDDARPASTSLIERSWKRCVRDHGLDPSQPRAARIVTSQTLKEHQDRADELLNVARAGVEQLYRQVAQLGYVLLLTDQRGITVQFLGEKAEKRRLRQAGLYLGADWREQHAGTCGVGTCIEEGLSLTCHQNDHFDATHIGLTCTAAPITDPSGDVLAVLDISALDSPVSRSSQTFALQLVTLYARMIEDAYFLRCYRDHHIFRCDASREFVHVNGEKMFALDDNGGIIAANTAGRTLMGQPVEAPAFAEPPAEFIQQLLDCEVADIWSITSGAEDQIRAFRTRDSNGILFGTVIEPKRPLRRGGAQQQNDPEHVPALDALAADDPRMRKTLALAKRLRNETVNIVIVGETGTGKERLARALHDSSSRAGRAFVAVNCAAIPESLIESELFGYRPGTFTGGHSRGMQGLLQQADGGTLFLDEIGDMPLNLQTRLLRVLSEREVTPLGAKQPMGVDLRVIAATHRDINEMVGAGEFREDLYYRLNGASLRLPPLRERADRQYLIQAVFDALIRERECQVRLRADTMSALLAYHWPGNLRQLRNALAYALATTDDREIAVTDLPEECLSSIPHSGTPAIHYQDTGNLPPEAQELHRALRSVSWNVSAVARSLGVSRPTVYRRMQRYGIVTPNRR
ncbi:sigma-54-dependent Fis family transcriptional regulator [Ectothiorhodospiraceae bacterium WFHF3C12]|nr:sigma-54-dependent Fis family transcriptional regulator [Ectothiorhodospiraceae bacterium WFHF3C12]